MSLRDRLRALDVILRPAYRIVRCRCGGLSIVPTTIQPTRARCIPCGALEES